MALKTCRVCKLSKPYAAFSKDPNCKGGLQGLCKACRRVAYAAKSRMRYAPARDLADGPNLKAFIDSDDSDRFGEGLISAAPPARMVADVPIAPVPEGFTIRSVGTLVDADGNTERQWIGAAPEGEHYEEILPAMQKGQTLRGTSTLVDGTGNVRAQWIKTNQNAQDKLAAALEALSTIADRWQGKADPVPMPPVDTDRMMTMYPMGDPHIGMFSWEPETGVNFDLKIAERNACAAIDRLVAISPATKRAVLVNIGDFFHSDSRRNQTTSGTPVDVDGRFAKVLGVGVRIMRYHIDRILTKHADTEVKILGGNHDADTAQMLAICLSQFYEREPRVRIDTSPSKFQKYRFGKNLFGFTHQDTVKIDALGEIMACDWPQDWAETLHRYWITGHIHHKTVTELRGCIVESLRTLASADAWHRGQGYRSGRDMQAIVYDHDLGEVLRHRVGIAEIEGA